MKIFKRIQFRSEKEEITDDDLDNINKFVTSGPIFESVKKMLRNRKTDRNTFAIHAIKEGSIEQSIVHVSQMEELDDIIQEWENILKDIKDANS